MDYALYTFHKESKNPWTAQDWYTRYHWARRRLEYIFRLMFAVTLDEVYTSRNYKPELAEQIFPNLMIGTIGELWNVAVKYLIPRLPTDRQLFYRQVWGSDKSSWLVEEYEACCYSTGLLGLKAQRNVDAHPAVTPDNLAEYLERLKQRMLEIQEHTGGKYFCLDENGEYEHSYVVIEEAADQNQSEEVKGYVYSRTGEWSLQMIYRRELQRYSDPLGGQLYLKISRKDDLCVEYIRLSPFISFEKNILSIYMGLAAQFSNSVQTVQIPIEPGKGNDEKYVVDCVLESLIPRLNKQDGYYSFSASNNRNIQINISRYPDFENLKNASFPYCMDICDVVHGAEQFCQMEMPGATYRTIYGDGGVGKTTLVFHLIHDIILRGKSMFNRVIFLSAKNYFRRERSDQTVPIRGEEITPDFASYEELVRILYRLLCKYPSKAELPNTITQTEEALLNKINGGGIPKTILILDDLDTLTEPEQRQVRRLLGKTSGKWVKTLITTRSSKYVTEQDFHIRLLNQEQSMKFLHWCIRQRRPDFADSHCMSQNPAQVHSLTEGRPIDLYAWASLVIHGVDAPVLYSKYLLPGEKTKYLYRTVMQNLCQSDQILFRLLCGINEAACTSQQLKQNFRAGIPLRLVQYLLPDQTITESTFSTLIEFKLVVQDQNTIPFGAEYQLRDFCYLDILENNIMEGLPEYLQDILQLMKQDGNWLPDRYTDRLTTGICYLLGNLRDSETEKKEMFLCMARNMLSDAHRDALTESQMEKLRQCLYGQTTPVASSFNQQCNILYEQIQHISSHTPKADLDEIYAQITELKSQAKTEEDKARLRNLLLFFREKTS